VARFLLLRRLEDGQTRGVPHIVAAEVEQDATKLDDSVLCGRGRAFCDRVVIASGRSAPVQEKADARACYQRDNQNRRDDPERCEPAEFLGRGVPRRVLLLRRLRRLGILLLRRLGVLLRRRLGVLLLRLLGVLLSRRLGVLLHRRLGVLLLRLLVLLLSRWRRCRLRLRRGRRNGRRVFGFCAADGAKFNVFRQFFAAVFAKHIFPPVIKKKRAPVRC